MQNKQICLPSNIKIKWHILSALQQYWHNKAELIDQLPIFSKNIDVIAGEPLMLKSILLPSWGRHCGVDGVLLVPSESIPVDYVGSDADLWREVDWFAAAFLLLECWHERLWEDKFGPIHSYSFRLKGWDERAWQHAWVNRIGLFLREWSANVRKDSSQSIFGQLAAAKIQMTHDVDAVKKTLAIRIKQSVFILFNAVRALVLGNVQYSVERFKKAISFFFGRENWMVFDKLIAQEKEAEIVSTFHFYADLRAKSFKRWLFDPGYRIESAVVKDLLIQLIKNKHVIGLHPSFDCWDSNEELLAQKKSLEAASGITVSHVRQHWLRFSWHKTWACQEVAGLTLDTTLMFNDRPGFRNSSALCWQPWNSIKGESFVLEALPSTIMDSHFYDYLQLGDEKREEEMSRWIRECVAVSGSVAVLWHPHTLSREYGWSAGFTQLLNLTKFDRR